MKFTQDDLRFQMPMKLANAWGLNSSNLDWNVQKHYDNYSKVLSHPLFVGLFCLMINEEDYNLEDLGDNLPECDYKEYGPHHIKFIQSVINFGINISIKSRYPELPQKTLGNIRKAFLNIASGYFIRGFSDIKSLWEWNSEFGVFLTKEEREIIISELGVMYLSDGDEITWTHRTISEVATGMKLYEEAEIHPGHELQAAIHSYAKTHKYYQNLNWSECLILTLGLLSSEQKGHFDYRIELMNALLTLQAYDLAEKTLELIFFYQPVFQIENFDYENCELNAGIIFEKGSVEHKLGESYLNYLNSKIKEHRTRDGLVDNRSRPLSVRLVRIPQHCYLEFSRDFQMIPNAIEIFNMIEFYVGAFPITFPSHEMNLWPPLILTDQISPIINLHRIERLQPHGMKSPDPVWTLIKRHFHYVLISQPSGLDLDRESEVLYQKLTHVIEEYTSPGAFDVISPTIGPGLQFGFQSNILRDVIGIHRNYGFNTDLLELICGYYANQIFPNNHVHQEIALHYREWLNDISSQGLLPEIFQPSEIDVIKQAYQLNSLSLDIVSIFRIFCNPNITMKATFVPNNRISTLIKENGNIRKNVAYRGG